MAEVIDLTHGEPDPPTTLKMWLDVCPMAKPSVRYGPGRGGAFRFYYNHRVQAAMQDLRNAVMDEMTRLGMDEYPRNQPLSLKVWFFLKRPKSDFINRQRVAGRLKPSALAEAGTIVAVKADIDNLAKFVLDSLKHSIYSDDAQVVELHMFKLRDSEGLCSGRMAIQCSPMDTTSQQLMPDF